MDFSLDNFDCAKHCKSDKLPSEPNASGLIDDIMKKYFCHRAGQGSSCSVFSKPQGSVYSMDKRLEYWTRILEDRKRIACRIQKATGKRLSHVLYNQIEYHRNVQNVKRVIDIAERLHPTNISRRKTENIKETLFETLPLSERLETPNLELVGTPKVTMDEQWLHPSAENSNSFLKSSYLQRKLKSAAMDRGGLLEHYPDIAELGVVGHRISKHPKPIAEVISDYELSVVSSVSGCDSWEGQEFPEYRLQINGTLLGEDMKLAETMTIHLSFACTPYANATQSLCKVKNIGKKPVNLHVRRVKPKGAAYLPSYKKVFDFNINFIRLAYAESVEIEVTFRSDQRRVYEEYYFLLTEPNFFDDKHKIMFKLTGDCYLPQNYLHSIVKDLLDAVLSSIFPGKRKALTDKELFEQQNPGLKCEPQDLRKFCEIYRQVKRKHHPSRWNFNLQALKEMIDGVLDYEQRAAYSEVFSKTIHEIRRRSPNCNSNINILLARTVIVSNLDKWEKKALQIRHSVATTDIDLLIIKMPFETIMEQIKHCQSEQEKRRIILHNALFIQMFCCLCDLAEDIVSFVENCLKLHAF